MHAVLRNHTKMLEMLLGLVEEPGTFYDGADNFGKSAAHYVVCPLIRGSYENDKLLKTLHEAKFNMTEEDADGMAPSDYAQLQKTQKLYKMFQKLKIVPADGADQCSIIPDSVRDAQKEDEKPDNQITEK